MRPLASQRCSTASVPFHAIGVNVTKGNAGLVSLISDLTGDLAAFSS
jgi:hypothetical protein